MKKLLLTGGLLLSFCFLGFGQVDTVAVIKEVDSLIQVGRILSRQKKHEEALAAISAAKDKTIQNFDTSSVLYANCQFNLGFVYQNWSRRKEAEPYYINAKDLRARILGKESQDYAWSLNNLGLLYKDQGRYDLAEPLYLEAIGIRKKILGPDNRDYASSLYNLANLFLAKQNYRDAEPLLEQAYTIWQKEPEKNELYISFVQSQRAFVYRVVGKFEKAEKILLENLEKFNRQMGVGTADYAHEIVQLAALYKEFGLYDKVEPLYLEGIAIQEKLLGKDNLFYANSVDGLANYYLEIGDYLHAEFYYLIAKGIWDKQSKKEHYVHSTTVGNLAALYRSIGDLKKAEFFILQTKVLQEEVIGKKHASYAKTLGHLAWIYTDMGRYQDAEPLFLEAIEIWNNTYGEFHPVYANALINLGGLYQKTGRFDLAKTHFEKAKDIIKASLGENNKEYSGSLLRLASLYWLQNQNELATFYFLESNPINLKSLSTVSHFLSEEELTAIGHVYDPVFDAHLSFAATHSPSNVSFYNSCYDNALFRKGFLINVVSGVRKLAFTDSLAFEKFVQLKANYRWLAKLYALPKVERDSSILTELEDETNQLEKNFTRTVAGFGEALRQVSWQEVQSALKPGEAAVEFIRFNYYTPEPTDSVMYAALLLKPGMESPAFISLFEERQLQAILAPLVGQGRDGLNDLYAGQAGQSLYQLLWSPLEASLGGTKSVYVSPAGLLHRLNLGAIPTTPTSTETIGKRYGFTVVGSTRQLVVGSAPQSTSGAVDAVVFGGIQYEMDSTAIAPARPEESNTRNRGMSFSQTDSTLRGDTWRYLKYSEKEVTNIQSQLQKAGFQVGVYKGLAATEESFKQIGKDRPAPKILHLSTHGFFFPDVKNQSKSLRFGLEEPVFKVSDNPMIRAGLILAGGNYAWKHGKPLGDREDGILTAYEISQMDLRNTDLVVLSACETGLGQIEGNEGVYGLQRAFKIAGAKHLVMSLWQVPDFHTHELMTAFYNNMLTKKMPTRAALVAAQEEMRLKRYEPFYWAGFVLVE